jgi:hypothetical protein
MSSAVVEASEETWVGLAVEEGLVEAPDNCLKKSSLLVIGAELVGTFEVGIVVVGRVVLTGAELAGALKWASL